MWSRSFSLLRLQLKNLARASSSSTALIITEIDYHYFLLRGFRLNDMEDVQPQLLPQLPPQPLNVITLEEDIDSSDQPTVDLDSEELPSP